MKIKEFQQILEENNCGFAVFYTPDASRMNPNMFYFSKYNGIGALVIPKNKEPFLIAPDMELEKARHCMKKVYSMQKKRFFESIMEITKKHRLKARKVAIDNTNFNLNSYKALKKQFRVKTKDVSLDCLKLRETKTEKEVNYLRKSCNYVDRILQKAIKNFKDFSTESEVAAFLEYETKKQGLELSFSPIIASGSNGSMPHYEPKNAKIKNGFCVLDFGVKYEGYCSDMTRTIYVGKPSEKEKEIYGMLLRIQNDVINLVEKNKKCSELYDFVVKSLGKYKDNFTHGLGHGVGVEIHELPNLSMASKDTIQNNMVFTIEPGIYFPRRFGIRIEDTLLFRNKTEVLTRTTKDMLIVN